MNRLDEIQAVARDVADWVCADADDRNKMADDLIKLVTLVVQATGKHVAVAGESAANDAIRHGEEFPGEAAEGHALYRTGERIQDGARWVADEAVGADLDRYERSGLAPVWTPKGHAAGRLTRQAQAAVDALLATSQAGPARLNVDALADSPEIPVPTADAPHACQPVTALDGDDRPDVGLDGKPYTICGICGLLMNGAGPERPDVVAETFNGIRFHVDGTTSQRPQQDAVTAVAHCEWLPGDATPACDMDEACPVHGRGSMPA